MRRNTILVLASVLLLVAVGTSTGCRRVKLADTGSRTSGAATETTSVAIGQAQTLDTTVRMAVGSLKLTAEDSSSPDAMRGTFRYAPASWKPDVTYVVLRTKGVLSATQPDSSGALNFGRAENTWTLVLAAGIPTNLSLELGVGDSDIGLRGVNLTGLKVVTGVGKTTIDLSGPRPQGLVGRIDSGVG